MLTIEEYSERLGHQDVFDTYFMGIPVHMILRVPCCGKDAIIEDPDDFYDKDVMHREETHQFVCPYCQREFDVKVRWEPDVKVIKR